MAFDALSLAHARAQFRRQISVGTDDDFSRPSGTGPFYIATQAHRAWLLSACPSGTKSMTQEHAIKAAELCLKAQASAHRID
jgi:hypothetical protein